jgi:ribosomal protein L1
LMERLASTEKVASMRGGDKNIPSGFQKAASGGLEPIPGGPADLKQQDAFTKATQAHDAITYNLDMVSAKANALAKHPGLGKITGMVGAFPNMPGSEAANAKAALDSLKASVGLDTLVALKQGSGAGLGQVTEAEHKLLQNYISALEQAQSEDAMKKALSDISTWTQKARGRVSTAYGTRWGSKPAPTAAPEGNNNFRKKYNY